MRSHAKAVVAVSAVLLTLALVPVASADAPPVVTIDPAVPSYTSAHLSGEVNPEGGPSTTFWQLQYSPESDGPWFLVGSGEFSGTEAEETTPLPVSADATGLGQNTTYFFRLIAVNEDGANQSIKKGSFTTLEVTAPSVSIDPVVTFTSTTAHFSGDVNPNAPEAEPTTAAVEEAFATKYRFQCTPACPKLEGNLVADNSSHDVEADATKLLPGTEYFVSLVARNGGPQNDEKNEEQSGPPATIAGPVSFTTPPTAPAIVSTSVSKVFVGAATLNAQINPSGATTTYAFQYIGEADFQANQPNEVQTLTVSATGGTFTLTFDGKTTAALPFDASAEEVRSNLQALSSIADVSGFVKVSGGPGDAAGSSPYSIAFSGTLGNADLSELSADATLLSGGSASADVITANEGGGGFDGAIEVPDPAGEISGSTVQAVHEEVFSLDPDTAYRYRVIATNSVDETVGPTRILKTPGPTVANPGKFPGQGFLPNNRAWELVSPIDKNGGEIIASPFRTRAAEDGSALLFASLQAFPKTPGIEGGGTSSEYMALRSGDSDPGNNGWNVRGKTPILESVGLGGALLGSEARFWSAAPDLSKGAFYTSMPLKGTDLNVEAGINLYVSDTNLRGPDPLTFKLVSKCPRCEETNQKLLPFDQLTPPTFAGASADFQQILFESRLRLTSDATANDVNLYEWDDGSLRLAGILPNGEPAQRSIVADGASVQFSPRYLRRGISADGSRLFFTVAPSTLLTRGTIYGRTAGRTTFQVNASELASPESPQSASFWGMSADGSRAFFTTPERLTEDAPEGPSKLYMWKQADENETQAVAVNATGGSFRLSFNEATTDPIAFDAPTDTVQSALEGLETVKSGNVSVTGGPGSAGASTPYEITFIGDFAGVNVAELTADGAGLSGGAASTTVTTPIPVHNLTLLSVDSQPADEEGPVKGVIGTSEDGRYVYFVAEGQLVDGAPSLEPVLNGPGSDGIYLWHDGTISYVSRAPAIAFDGARLLGSTNSFALAPVQASVTPDGGHLLFFSSLGTGVLSARGGIDADHGACQGQEFSTIVACTEFYLYSADSDELACVSCDPGGATPSGSPWTREAGALGASLTTPYISRVLSNNGRYSFFNTSERLVDEDFNGVKDVYVYDALTGEPHLISSGEDKFASYFLDAGADGRDAFFATRQPLSRWDVDTAYDIYDARVDGGFPEPPTPPLSCIGDACQPPPIALNDPTPASSSFSGPGDKRDGRARCRKGERKVKAKARGGKPRCVKKRHGKRNANSNRRAGR